jgi:hypothetical protein
MTSLFYEDDEIVVVAWTTSDQTVLMFLSKVQELNQDMH